MSVKRPPNSAVDLMLYFTPLMPSCGLLSSSTGGGSDWARAGDAAKSSSAASRRGMHPFRRVIRMSRIASPFLRCEVHVARVRAVYGGVAHGARLVFAGLVVEGRHGPSGGVHGQRVAFETEQVDLAALQKPRVGRTVRDVAGDAALDLDG